MRQLFSVFTVQNGAQPGCKETGETNQSAHETYGFKREMNCHETLTANQLCQATEI